MSEENIKRYTKKELEEMRARGKSQTDWARLDAMTDDDIDYSDIPPIPDDFWETAKMVYPQHDTEAILLKLDREILDWFKTQSDYQWRINAALRHFVHAQKEKMRQ